MLCSFLWYIKSPKTSHEILQKQLKEQDELQQKPLSLHKTLRDLTQNYILCKECFEQGNFPKVFKADDFKPTTMRSILGIGGKNDDNEDQDDPQSDGQTHTLNQDILNRESAFDVDEKNELIEAVTQQSSELIDWHCISQDVFNGKFSPEECVFEFLRLPISDSLSLKLETSPQEQQNSTSDVS